MANIDKTYKTLIDNIGTTLRRRKENTVKAVNQELITANQEIGKHIVEFEQGGKETADYGSSLLSNLSKDLKLAYGKGFGKSNLYLFRKFYLTYSNFQTLSGKLSWSHYAELLTISDDKARSFYEKQAETENWSFREMKRQIDSSLFERLSLSKDKEAVLKLSEKGQLIESPTNLIRDLYVFEFLGIPEQNIVKERDLENKLIENLQKFLLELGKGFSFIGQQYKITIDNQHFYIDLVFYHRILKCFVLIDLKTQKVKHQDIGQMNLYLNYFKEEENVDNDNEPIGIIIAKDKHEFLVKYATGGLSNKIFVSKYQLYLLDKKVLENKVNQIINE